VGKTRLEVTRYFTCDSYANGQHKRAGMRAGHTLDSTSAVECPGECHPLTVRCHAVDRRQPRVFEAAASRGLWRGRPRNAFFRGAESSAPGSRQATSSGSLHTGPCSRMMAAQQRCDPPGRCEQFDCGPPHTGPHAASQHTLIWSCKTPPAHTCGFGGAAASSATRRSRLPNHAPETPLMASTRPRRRAAVDDASISYRWTHQRESCRWRVLFHARPKFFRR
jgi:hypothetical protein